MIIRFIGATSKLTPAPEMITVGIVGGSNDAETGPVSVRCRKRNGALFGLDEAATHMWQLMIGTSDISTAFEKLVLEGYDVETETLRQHLIELKRLDENGLLTVVPSDVADVRTNPAI